MEQYIEQLKPLFSKIAEKIGQGAEFGWSVVFRQQIAYGVVTAFIAICGFLGMFLVYRAYKNIKAKEIAKIDLAIEYEGLLIWIVAGGIVSGIAFIAGTINAILYFTNPAYYALQFFINLVK